MKHNQAILELADYARQRSIEPVHKQTWDCCRESFAERENLLRLRDCILAAGGKLIPDRSYAYPFWLPAEVIYEINPYAELMPHVLIKQRWWTAQPEYSLSIPNHLSRFFLCEWKTCPPITASWIIPDYLHTLQYEGFIALSHLYAVGDHDEGIGAKFWVWKEAYKGAVS
jgi:hypothetical protein